MPAQKRSGVAAGWVWGLIIPTLYGALAIPAAARGETLDEAIALAYNYNPTLQAQRAALRALDETYVQARAGYGPTLNGTAEAGYDGAAVQQATFTGGVATVDNHGNTRTGSLTLTQPLYTGGRIRAEVDAAEAGILAGRQNLRQSEGQVLLGVITAFAAVRESQNLLSISTENVDVLRRELAETRERFRLRQATRTDVSQAEARTAAAEAQNASVQGRLDVARSQYVASVGENPAKLDEPPPFPGLPTTVDQAFDIAERWSPALLAANYTEQASRARIAEAKAASAPTISLRVDLTSGPIEPYDSHFYENSAQAMAVVNQPLFTAGLNASRVRQTLQQNNRDRFNIDAARRAAIQSVAQAWSQLVAAKATRAAQQRQVASDQAAFVGVQKEQRYGLRTVLDILNAEEELESAKSAVATADYDEYIASANLMTSIGLLEARFVAPGLPRYDPASNLRRVQNQYEVPWTGLIQRIDSVGFRSDTGPIQTNSLSETKPSAGADSAAAPNDVSAQQRSSEIGRP